MTDLFWKGGCCGEGQKDAMLEAALDVYSFHQMRAQTTYLQQTINPKSLDQLASEQTKNIDTVPGCCISALGPRY